MKPMSFLLCLLLVASAAEPDPFARSTQLIVVTTSDWSAVEGRLVRYERATPREPWRPLGEPIPIVVGKNGLGWGIGVIAADDPKVRAGSDPVKKEGDGKAPAGVFALGTAFGYAPQPLRGLKMPYPTLTPSVECVDDVGSKYYNRVVDRSAGVERRDRRDDVAANIAHLALLARTYLQGQAPIDTPESELADLDSAAPENSGRAFEKLTLPLRDLIGVDIELLRQLGQSLLPLDRGQSHFRLEGRCVIPSRALRHPIS